MLFSSPVIAHHWPLISGHCFLTADALGQIAMSQIHRSTYSVENLVEIIM